MEAKRITTGIVFLFIGAILLLNKMDVIDFNWFETVRYWPLLIILLGVNILVPKNQTGYMISIGTTCVILGIFTFIGITTPNKPFMSQIMNNNSININGDDEDFTGASHNVSVKNLINSTAAVANIDLGATKIKLEESTEQNLFEATNTSEKYFLTLNSETKNDNSTTINVEGKTKKGLNSKGNTTNIRLNKSVVWDLNFDVGATDFQGDLSSFKIKNLNIDAGASSLNFKLGQPIETSTINIDAGASSIQISIPKDAACQIITEMALSSLDADASFIKGEDNGILTTSNYNSATNKFNITIDGGITSITLRRY